MLYRGDDTRRLTRLAAIAERALVPLIAVNDVLYHVAERRPLQDVVTCIREHVTIDAAGRLLEANAERHLKPGHEMARLFRRAPEAIDQTLRFLDRCNFSLGELRKTEYPDENRVGFPTPQDALDTMLYIHDRYALDGRDPNTYTNCLWCFGLHDRPFGERPIFGQVRYMSLAGMRRKTDVDAYIREIDNMGVTTA